MTRRNLISGTATALGAAAQTSGAASVSMFDGKGLAGWTVENGPETAFYVNDGAIVAHESAGYPAWLRSERQYENFDFRCEFFVRGWMDSGVFIHAPEDGRNTWEGIQVKIFQDVEPKPSSNSMGSLFPLVAPRSINVRNKGEWNTMRIRMDWPRLQVWTNGEQVQNFDVESDPRFRYRLRKGYIGLSTLTYPVRFRNLAIEELPGKEKWDVLFDGPSSMERWYITDGKPKFEAIGRVLRADGLGYLGTKELFRDFELRLYARGRREHNSGVLFRTDGHGSNSRHYEIQLHDVPDAHYPTGSLYHFKRAEYPRIGHEEWYPFHLIAQGKRCIVRINGDTVCDYDEMTNLEEGHIELQAHRMGYWTEFKDIRIKRL